MKTNYLICLIKVRKNIKQELIKWTIIFLFNDWNIEKYRNRVENTLTREEIIDVLNIFRGENGTSYIYFFKFPLYKELGNKTDELLNVKDTYRININDEEVQKNIKDIFYGYDESNSDNKILDKDYYENKT